MCKSSCMTVTLKLQKVLHVIAVLLTVSPLLSGYTWNKSSKGKIQDSHVNLLPEFDDLSIREIPAKKGQTVLLPCTVRNLGDKVVSWIRTKDLHILTSGSHTFSADNRFESVSSVLTNFWGLRVRGVRISDSGRYECQVNTDPKMSLGINLTVTDFITAQPEEDLYKSSDIARIKGPSEIYIREGSPAILTCEILTSSSSSPSRTTSTHSFFAPTKSPIFWLHEGEEISFDSSRGGISVEADYRDRNSVSRLRVAEVSPQDGGLYTCTRASAKPSSVKVIVVQTERSEAMQHDAPYSSSIQLNKDYFTYLIPLGMFIFTYLYSSNIFFL